MIRSKEINLRFNCLYKFWNIHKKSTTKAKRLCVINYQNLHRNKKLNVSKTFSKIAVWIFWTIYQLIERRRITKMIDSFNDDRFEKWKTMIVLRAMFKFVDQISSTFHCFEKKKKRRKKNDEIWVYINVS